jgi:hypothetical protein
MKASIDEIGYDPINIPTGYFKKSWKKYLPELPHGLDMLKTHIAKLSTDDLGCLCRSVREEFEKRVGQKKDTKVLYELYNLVCDIAVFFSQEEHRGNSMFIEFAQTARAWPATLAFGDLQRIRSSKKFHNKLYKKYFQPSKSGMVPSLKKVEINKKVGQLLYHLVKTWAIMQRAKPTRDLGLSLLWEAYQAPHNIKAKKRLLAPSPKMQMLYSNLVKLPPPNLENAEQWGEIVFQRVLAMTGGHPETNLDFAQLGEYRRDHTFTLRSGRSAAANARDGIKTKIKRQVRQFLKVARLTSPRHCWLNGKPSGIEIEPVF